MTTGFLFGVEDEEAQLLFLSHSIPAIQLISDEDGQPRLGPILQLAAGLTLEICGAGFNSETVQARLHDHTYFVFLKDLDSLRHRRCLHAGSA